LGSKLIAAETKGHETVENLAKRFINISIWECKGKAGGQGRNAEETSGQGSDCRAEIGF
jgi:hypothetical protein